MGDNLSLSQIEDQQIHDFRLISGGSLILYIGKLTSCRGLTEWRLHIEPAWRLQVSSTVIVGSLETVDLDSADPEPIENVLTRMRPMRGLAIQEVELAGPVVDLTIKFNDGYSLATFSHAIEGENWELRHASGLRLGMGNPCELRSWREPADSESGQ